MSMKQLIMCQGLPGSGKTRFALGLVANSPSDTARVNKDDIRRDLEQAGLVWTPAAEQDVIRIRDSRIANAFLTGAQTVISDDTNFGHKHKARLAELAVLHGATFVVKRFDTPIDECIRRDAERNGQARVGEKVIRDMAARYGVGQTPHYEQFAPYVPLTGLYPPAILCDLDGTLALGDHRSPYDASTCEQDRVNEAVRSVLWTYKRFTGVSIVYVSGRSDAYRTQTEAWLISHAPFPDFLYMRKAGDVRKDWIVKGEIFDQYIRHRFRVLFVLDDRQQVVDFWRYLGLTCFQVAKGDF